MTHDLARVFRRRRWISRLLEISRTVLVVDPVVEEAPVGTERVAYQQARFRLAHIAQELLLISTWGQEVPTVEDVDGLARAEAVVHGAPSDHGAAGTDFEEVDRL